MSTPAMLRWLRRRYNVALVGSFRAGLLQRLGEHWHDRLIVLTYHRIADLTDPAFASYRRTVNATPEAFAEQLDFLAQHCQVVSLADVVAAAHEGRPLPARAVLITFDDGYRDNVETALPLLEAHGMRATIFLASDFVGRGVPFYWDLVANLFQRSAIVSSELPLLGHRAWERGPGSSVVAEEFVERAKRLPDAERRDALERLSRTLDVQASPADFDNLYLTWDDVRRGAARGLDFGSHTRTHAILPGLAVDRQRDELVSSKRRLEHELGREVTALAYPNGDCDRSVEALAQEAGYKVAFTMQRGPSRAAGLRRRPWAVRRIPVYMKDTLARFAAKLVGLH